MDVDWVNTCEEQPERMRNLAKELRLALFPQVSARKFRNWSTVADSAQSIQNDSGLTQGRAGLPVAG